MFRAHIVNVLTVVNEKGDKSILEPLMVKQMVIVILIELLFIAVTRIALEDVHKEIFADEKAIILK